MQQQTINRFEMAPYDLICHLETHGQPSTIASVVRRLVSIGVTPSQAHNAISALLAAGEITRNGSTLQTSGQ
jgi:hypothetical protein